MLITSFLCSLEIPRCSDLWKCILRLCVMYFSVSVVSSLVDDGQIIRIYIYMICVLLFVYLTIALLDKIQKSKNE